MSGKKKRKRPRCKTCIYFDCKPKPGRKTACDKFRQPDLPACSLYYPKMCIHCMHFILRTCRWREHLEPFEPACSNFLYKGKFMVSVSDTPVLSDIEEKYEEGFYEILKRIYAIEKSSQKAVDRLTKNLERQGVIVPFNRNVFNQIVSLVTKVLTLSMVSQLCGVSYAFDILLDEVLRREGRNVQNENPRSVQVDRGRRLPGRSP